MPTSPEKPTSRQVWAISFCFLLLFLALSGLVMYLWSALERIDPAILHIGPVPPPVADSTATTTPAVQVKVVPDSSALLIVMLVGGLGGLLHSMRSFYFHLSKGDLVRRSFPKHLSRPISGAILAAVFFFAFRAGLADTNIQSTDAGLVLYAALAGLVGMFSDQTVAKLKKIAEAIFSVAEREDDKPVQPPLAEEQEEDEEENVETDEDLNGHTEGGQPDEEHPQAPAENSDGDKEGS